MDLRRRSGASATSRSATAASLQEKIDQSMQLTIQRTLRVGDSSRKRPRTDSAEAEIARLEAQLALERKQTESIKQASLAKEAEIIRLQGWVAFEKQRADAASVEAKEAKKEAEAAMDQAHKAAEAAFTSAFKDVWRLSLVNAREDERALTLKTIQNVIKQERAEAAAVHTGAIAAERKAASEALTGAIAAEKKAASKALTEAIAAEKKAASKTLTEAIAAERKAALEALTGAIAAERKAALEVLTGAIAVERKAASEALTGAIAAERKAAAEVLTGAIAAERKATAEILKRAIAAEKAAAFLVSGATARPAMVLPPRLPPSSAASSSAIVSSKDKPHHLWLTKMRSIPGLDRSTHDNAYRLADNMVIPAYRDLMSELVSDSQNQVSSSSIYLNLLINVRNVYLDSMLGSVSNGANIKSSACVEIINGMMIELIADGLDADPNISETDQVRLLARAVTNQLTSSVGLGITSAIGKVFGDHSSESERELLIELSEPFFTCVTGAAAGGIFSAQAQLAAAATAVSCNASDNSMSGDRNRSMSPTRVWDPLLD